MVQRALQNVRWYTTANSEYGRHKGKESKLLKLTFKFKSTKSRSNLQFYFS